MYIKEGIHSFKKPPYNHDVSLRVKLHDKVKFGGKSARLSRLANVRAQVAGLARLVW